MAVAEFGFPDTTIVEINGDDIMYASPRHYDWEAWSRALHKAREVAGAPPVRCIDCFLDESARMILASQTACTHLSEMAS